MIINLKNFKKSRFLKISLVVTFFLIVLFLYTYKLKENLLFSHDTARDTARILEIWQKKELTLIGPAISFGQYGTRQVFFGSLALYIGLLGLIISRFSVIGPILPNIFFVLLSIPFFFLLAKQLGLSKRLSLVTTAIYALSPVTITYTRFFWNPNLIMPFSVFFWYLLLKKYKNKRQKLLGFFLAGVIGGGITNFHYFSLFPTIIYLFFLLSQKQLKNSLLFIFGLLAGLSPLLLFELKHNFYLSSSLIFNFRTNPVSPVTSVFHIENFFDPFWTVIGLKQTEILHRVVNVNVPMFFIFITLLLIYLMATTFKNIYQGKKFLVFIIFSVIIFTIKLTGGVVFQIHYLFPVYPLLIWYIGVLMSRVKPIFYVLLFIPIFISDFFIVSEKQSIKRDYLNVATIEAITQTIVKDKLAVPYNISENIGGGAQAIPFRFFLNRDTKIKPNDIKSYLGLRTLYVISPSLNITLKENRWEFYATPNLVLTKTFDFTEVKLFKFEAK